MSKNCPSCDSPQDMEKISHCNDCDEIVCVNCEDNHFGQHCDPYPITKEEFDNL